MGVAVFFKQVFNDKVSLAYIKPSCQGASQMTNINFIGCKFNLVGTWILSREVKWAEGTS